MKNNSQREEIKKGLLALEFKKDDPLFLDDNSCKYYLEVLIDYVIADRARIVEPLVKMDFEPVKNLTALGLCDRYAQTIREVLTLALGDSHD